MDSTPHGAAVTAAGFGVKGPRGWAFRDIDIDAAPGSLIAVQGPSGSGRTCLLLALTGRMKSAEGTAEVGGLPLPKKRAAVRSVTALAHVPGVAELDPALTVGEHLRERALLQGRFGGSLRALLRPRQERRAEARALVDAALDGGRPRPGVAAQGDPYLRARPGAAGGAAAVRGARADRRPAAAGRRRHRSEAVRRGACRRPGRCCAGWRRPARRCSRCAASPPERRGRGAGGYGRPPEQATSEDDRDEQPAQDRHDEPAAQDKRDEHPAQNGDDERPAQDENDDEEGAADALAEAGRA